MSSKSLVHSWLDASNRSYKLPEVGSREVKGNKHGGDMLCLMFGACTLGL